MDTPGADSSDHPASADQAAEGPDGAHPHNFEAQKELHRRIRNDPDYDDWDYGTEPLPKEAWPTPHTPDPR